MCCRDVCWVHCSLLSVLMIWISIELTWLVNLLHDTKIGGIVESDECYLSLQKDFDQLVQWAKGLGFKRWDIMCSCTRCW